MSLGALADSHLAAGPSRAALAPGTSAIRALTAFALELEGAVDTSTDGVATDGAAGAAIGSNTPGADRSEDACLDWLWESACVVLLEHNNSGIGEWDMGMERDSPQCTPVDRSRPR